MNRIAYYSRQQSESPGEAERLQAFAVVFHMFPLSPNPRPANTMGIYIITQSYYNWSRDLSESEVIQESLDRFEREWDARLLSTYGPREQWKILGTPFCAKVCDELVIDTKLHKDMELRIRPDDDDPI